LSRGAIAYKQGILGLLVDPELASADTLAADANLISITDEELEKLLAALYQKEEKKLGYIPISPEARIGFVFNVKNMITRYLQVLRNADEMMIHFLNVANQVESIERFMKTVAKVHEARWSWLRWVMMIILSLAIGLAIISVVSGGG